MKKTVTGDDDNWFNGHFWVTLIHIGGDDDDCDYDGDGEEEEEKDEDSDLKSWKLRRCQLAAGTVWGPDVSNRWEDGQGTDHHDRDDGGNDGDNAKQVVDLGKVASWRVLKANLSTSMFFTQFNLRVPSLEI